MTYQLHGSSLRADGFGLMEETQYLFNFLTGKRSSASEAEFSGWIINRVQIPLGNNCPWSVPSKTVVISFVFTFLDWDQHLGSSLLPVLVPLETGEKVSILGLHSQGGQYVRVISSHKTHCPLW